MGFRRFNKDFGFFFSIMGSYWKVEIMILFDLGFYGSILDVTGIGRRGLGKGNEGGEFVLVI